MKCWTVSGITSLRRKMHSFGLQQQYPREVGNCLFQKPLACHGVMEEKEGMQRPFSNAAFTCENKIRNQATGIIGSFPSSSSLPFSSIFSPLRYLLPHQTEFFKTLQRALLRRWKESPAYVVVMEN